MRGKGSAGLVRRLGALVVVSGEELKRDPVSRLVGGSLLLVPLELVVHEARRQATRCEPSREPRGVVAAEEIVARIEVVGN